MERNSALSFENGIVVANPAQPGSAFYGISC